MGHFTGTETPLGAATDFVGDTMLRNTFDTVKGTVFSDTPGTLSIDQGWKDKTGVVRWDATTTVAVTANTGQSFSQELVAALWRVRFTQAGTQTVFRLSAAATAAGFVGG